MATINYYLRKPDQETSPIELVYHFKGHRLRLCIGESISPKKWNKVKQRAKETELSTRSGDTSLNSYLEALSLHIRRVYQEEMQNGTLSPAKIKQGILEFFEQAKSKQVKETLYDLIGRFIANEFTLKGRGKSDATIKTYRTALKHLKEFEKASRYKIDFDSINLNFYHKYTTYLKVTGKSINTVGKQIQLIKAFMNMAVDLKLTDNTEFKRPTFAVPREDTDAIYLSESEILRLYTFDFSHNKRLEQVRDLFVFGCYVGLRYSDISNVRPENIITSNEKTEIVIKSQKTNELVIIPCHAIVKHIFAKYNAVSNSCLPPIISNQKFNNYIKEAAKEAGFIETGRLTTNLTLPLYACISSHTCRRSFATNYYGKVPTRTLMYVTGHRSEKSFLKYIKTSKQESAQILSEVMEMEYNKVVLQVLP